MEKKWKCTVCGYIHTGEQPPEVCPVCKRGPEVFILLEEQPDEKNAGDAGELVDKKKIQEALFNISYGLYVVGSAWKDKINAQICNTVFQVTSDPMQVMVGINKKNLTYEYITNSGIITIGILGQDGHDLVKHFGFQTGHQVDKFADMKYSVGVTGGPLVEGCIAYLEGRAASDKTLDAGTHSVFLIKIIAGETVKKAEPMTYAYYRQTRK
jgi:flavin reductase (DIM6/NTAB) family NADH-FMN oxidoreductase RutF/rubredoxin